MSAADVVLRGRERAEEHMVDTLELRGPDVRGTLDPDTGQYPITPGPLKYSGPGKIQTTDVIGNAADAVERVVMVTRFGAHLPMSAPAAAVDDVITVKASELDPQLVDRRFRVVSLVHKSLMTARRLAVEETQS